jgi:hypothetical protein
MYNADLDFRVAADGSFIHGTAPVGQNAALASGQ